jgi:hypothetical protein
MEWELPTWFKISYILAEDWNGQYLNEQTVMGYQQSPKYWVERKVFVFEEMA